MQLELAADAEAVAGLSRLKALTASREGRPRTQSVKIVWHDSPEHALLADGVSLAEQRGVRRLERIFPGPATWLPATPAPALTEDPDPATLPAPLAPLAAFEARQAISLHQLDGQVVTVTAAKGILRAVTAEQPVGRVWLEGEDHAVRAIAMLIAQAIPVAVPLTSLAAEAIALATGRPAPPRRRGAPILPIEIPSIPDALTHILGHLIDVILANASVAVRPGTEGMEAVHQMRVAVRRIRSALSIFRPVVPPGALDATGASLKQLGAMLGPTRDWDVFADETVPLIQAVLPNNPHLERLVSAAARRRKECQKILAAYLSGPAFRTLGIELAWFASASFWHIQTPAEPGIATEPMTLESFAAQVLQQRWKKLLTSGKRIEELDIPSLHAVRLRAKRTRYAAEMFAALHHGKSASRFIRRLSVLQERLGVLNDGAVATHLMEELGGPTGRHAYATGIIAGFMAARAAQIRPRIVRAFERFRHQSIYWT
jgi:triphosphatase